MNRKQIIKSIFGGVLGIGLYFICLSQGMSDPISKTIGVTSLIAYLWITESINIYLTSLLPIILFPALGLASIKDLSGEYMHDIIFLFIGGFLLAFAIEKVDLHKRIAYWMLKKSGNEAWKLLLSFMFLSYFLSMWLLNTATTLLLIPPALGIINEVKKLNPNSNIAIPILLGIAYSASIGGTTTVIGTAPNAYLFEFLNDHYPSNVFDFVDWTMKALPISMSMFLACFTFFYFRFIRNKPIQINVDNIKTELNKLGPIKKQEKLVCLFFFLTVFLWFTKKQLGFIHPIIPTLKDSWIAISTVFPLFLITSNNKTILEWGDMNKIPLGVIFLFGAGFAINHIFSTSGLTIKIGEFLGTLNIGSPIVFLLGIIIFMVFFTEISSNTTSTILFIPILASYVNQMQLDPVLWLFPVCLSASFAFMLPVATPPNTIVFGTSMIPIKSMMRNGFWINLIGISILALWLIILG